MQIAFSNIPRASRTIESSFSITLLPASPDAVLRREAEFGVNIDEPRQTELTSIPSLEDRFVLICRDDHALASASVTLRSFYEVQRSSTAVGLVAAGVAAAVVPRLAVQQGAYPSIRIVALTDPVVSRKLVLISRKNVQLSPAASALHDMILKQVDKAARS